MKLALPLDKMTIAEKLQALEQIWDDLCRTSDDVPSPSWHAAVLEHRDERVQEGTSEFVDWAKAKQKIRDSTK